MITRRADFSRRTFSRALKLSVVGKFNAQLPSSKMQK
jgi:hypothetical protein